MPKVFVSYRRDDSAGFAGRIFDRLQAHLGRESVFMDVDSIPFGVDIRIHIADAVSKCDALLAIMGDRWLAISQDGHSRLDDPKDFVRIEIEAALDRNIPVIPVLVGMMGMPTVTKLPPSLRPLAYRNACYVASGIDFHANVDRLISELERIAPIYKEAVEATVAAKPAAAGDDSLPPETRRTCSIVEVVSGPDEGKTYQLTLDRVLIGRNPDCDIAFDVGAMSRYHAQFVRTGNGYSLEDLGAANGSYVNGQLVGKRRVPLQDGDRIHTGTLILVYRRLDRMGPTAKRWWQVWKTD